MKNITKILTTWEGIYAIPLVTLFLIFCAGLMQKLNPFIGIFPEQYLQEIVYKITALIIGSNIVQIGIYINVMLFFNIKISDLKFWFTQLTPWQKLLIVVSSYALYYIVYALIAL
jgi:hypothetical protein